MHIAGVYATKFMLAVLVQEVNPVSLKVPQYQSISAVAQINKIIR